MFISKNKYIFAYSFFFVIFTLTLWGWVAEYVRKFCKIKGWKEDNRQSFPFDVANAKVDSLSRLFSSFREIFSLGVGNMFCWLFKMSTGIYNVCSNLGIKRGQNTFTFLNLSVDPFVPGLFHDRLPWSLRLLKNCFKVHPNLNPYNKFLFTVTFLQGLIRAQHLENTPGKPAREKVTLIFGNFIHLKC